PVHNEAELLDRCLAALGDDDWSVMRHPWRNCVFDEATYSATLVTRYDSAAMMRQHDRYLSDVWNHPRGWGLFATGNMVRRHTNTVWCLGEEWWGHNQTFSHQDQISLPVLFRTYAEGDHIGPRLRWNANLPWGEMWHLHPHGC
ncbi:MAG TPA: hypothetical protein VFG35_18930, partial [Actinoplanes sp.]|nr:hypothetical protein [Actinoplanes sp.]